MYIYNISYIYQYNTISLSINISNRYVYNTNIYIYQYNTIYIHLYKYNIYNIYLYK